MDSADDLARSCGIEVLHVGVLHYVDLPEAGSRHHQLGYRSVVIRGGENLHETHCLAADRPFTYRSNHQLVLGGGEQLLDAGLELAIHLPSFLEDEVIAVSRHCYEVLDVVLGEGCCSALEPQLLVVQLIENPLCETNLCIVLVGVSYAIFVVLRFG